jgi:hypothetical protein
VEDRIPRTVKLFSSDPEVVFFPEKYSQPFILVANLQNEIRYIVYSKVNKQQEVVLSCVDISSRELVKSWLLKIIPEKPEINSVHKLDCKHNQTSNIKYEYTNSLNSWVIYNFESNNPDLLKVYVYNIDY